MAVDPTTRGNIKMPMSETQFYVSVAIVPTVTIIIVLIGVLLNNSNMNGRFDDMNGRFDDLRSEMNARFGDMNARFDDMNARFDELRSEMNAGSGTLRSEMNARSDDLRSEMNARFEDIRETLRAEMAKNHSEMLLKFAELDRRLSRQEVGSSS